MNAPVPLRWFYLVLLWAAIGALAGAAVGGLEVRGQGYLELGLERNAHLTLRARTTLGMAAGAGLSVLALAVLLAVRALARPVHRRIAAAAARSRLAPTILVLGGALLTVALLPVARGPVRPLRVWALVAAVALWMVLRELLTRPGGGERHRLARLFDLAPPVLFLSVLVLDRNRLVALLDPRVGVVASGLMLAAAGSYALAIRPAVASGRLPGWAWLLVLPAALPAIIAMAGEAPPRPPIERLSVRNVVLIGIDTLRWDHSPSGGDTATMREVTPNLARLGREGTVFRTAISQAPWTLPAFSSILTGKYPRQHGAYSTFSAIGDEQVTLAEVLREAGYRTGGVVSHLFVDRPHGFAQGFDAFDDRNAVGEWAITSRHVTDQAVSLVRRWSGEPFFLFVHYFDPHFEYRDHPDRHWAERYTNWLSRQRLDIWTLLRYRHFLNAADVGYLRDLYREEVAFTDAEIGRLLNEIEERGLRGSTAIAVVADHGEEFLEHGWIGHGVSLNDEQIRVPLIVSLPGGQGAGRVVERTVETRSLFATVLDLLGIEPPAGTLVGPSLLPLVASGAVVEPEADGGVAYSEIRVPEVAFTTGKREIAAAVRQGGWKLVLDIERDRSYLFDLASDPGEKVDLGGSDPGHAAELRRLLDAWLAEMDASAGTAVERAVDEETLQKLRALGYL